MAGSGSEREDEEMLVLWMNLLLMNLGRSELCGSAGLRAAFSVSWVWFSCVLGRDLIPIGSTQRKIHWYWLNGSCFFYNLSIIYWCNVYLWGLFHNFVLNLERLGFELWVLPGTGALIEWPRHHATFHSSTSDGDWKHLNYYQHFTAAGMNILCHYSLYMRVMLLNYCS